MMDTEPSRKPVVDRLLHISDLHFWEIVRNPLKLMSKRFLGNLNVIFHRRHEFDPNRAQPCAQQLAAAGVPTVFAGGDFTSTAMDGEFAQAAEYLRLLKRLGMQVIVTPGNHDVYTFEAARKHRFEHYFKEFLPESGYPALYSLPGGTPFIVLDVARPNILTSRGEVSGKILIKTAELLAGISAPRILVGGHFPILHITSEYHSHWSRQLLNARPLRELLGTCGKQVLYVSGHVHRQSLTVDAEHSSLTHLTTSAFFSRGKQGAQEGGFSEIMISTDGFQVKRHTFSG